MIPAILVAIQWTASFIVSSGCWAIVIKAVDVVVDKTVDESPLEEDVKDLSTDEKDL